MKNKERRWKKEHREDRSRSALSNPVSKGKLRDWARSPGAKITKEVDE
jgi:hypothetical protein